jgi:hypothetical protein
MPGGQRGRRAATGPAGRALDVPRIVGVTEDRIAGLIVGQHHGDVGLADEDGAGFTEPRSNGAVLLSHIIRQLRKSDGGAHAGGRVHILEREGHAMERPPGLAARQGFIGLTRPCTGASDVHDDDRVLERDCAARSALDALPAPLSRKLGPPGSRLPTRLCRKTQDPLRVLLLVYSPELCGPPGEEALFSYCDFC